MNPSKHVMYIEF